jgi:hypothetical protein
MDYIKAAAQFLFLFVANVILDILGLVIVAIAIPFRVDGTSLSDGRKISNLPKWAWLFGNDYDGLLGDKRLWWAANTPFGLPVDHFISMYTWAALRNPVNNMRLTSMFSCPLDGSTVTYKGHEHVRDHAGEGGWQFVTTENNGKKWYGFYLVHEWSSTRAFVIRLGFKTEPKDVGSTERQGMTTKINPYKSI